VDGIDLGDVGQELALAAAHESPRVDFRLSDQTVVGREHFGVAQVDLGGLDSRLRCLDGRLLRPLDGDGGLVLLPRDGVFRDQRLEADDVLMSSGELRFRLREVRLRLRDGSLEGSGVDGIEKLSRLTNVPSSKFTVSRKPSTRARISISVFPRVWPMAST
jgi:hypothetical protein